MALIHGEKTTGKNGVLDNGEIANMLLRKSGSRADRGNCVNCATHIQDHTSTAGGGGITTKYAGRDVYHFSRGFNGGDDGCSVFYTLSAQKDSEKKDVLVAGIVTVGWHHNNNDDIYRLDWGKGAPFFTGGLLDITKQHQKS